MSAPARVFAVPPPVAVFSPAPEFSHRLGMALGRLWAAAFAGNSTGDDAAVMRPESPLILALNGQLGTGKTHFAKGIVEGLGGDPHDVTSPTFTLLNIYDLPAVRVFHYDCYRLAGHADAFDVGFEDAFAEGDAAGDALPRVVIIEWGERVPGLIPAGHAVREIFLHHATPTARRLLFANFSAAERAALIAAAEGRSNGPIAAA